MDKRLVLLLLHVVSQAADGADVDAFEGRSLFRLGMSDFPAEIAPGCSVPALVACVPAEQAAILQRPGRHPVRLIDFIMIQLVEYFQLSTLSTNQETPAAPSCAPAL